VKSSVFVCVCVCVSVCQCVSVCVCVEYYRAQSLLSCSSFQIEMLQDYAIKWGPCTRTQVRVGSWPPIQPDPSRILAPDPSRILAPDPSRILAPDPSRIQDPDLSPIMIGPGSVLSLIPIWVLSWSALDLSYHWSRSDRDPANPGWDPYHDPDHDRDPIVGPEAIRVYWVLVFPTVCL